jgi:hydroxylaminobenzene mutase
MRVVSPHDQRGVCRTSNDTASAGTVFYYLEGGVASMNGMDSAGIGRSNLRQGAAFMMAGLVWGMAVGATPFPRLALGAHIQLTAHGVMFLVAGLVISHSGLGTGRAARFILTAGPWLTWPLVLSEMANAWWGTRSMLPIAAQQAGASGAAPWQEGIVAAAHLLGAVVMLVYWGTILAGLFRKTG